MRQIHSGHRSNYSGFRALGLLATLWLAIAIPFTASAQMVPSSPAEPAPIEVPENLTPEQVRDLVARLSDDQVRELIITQLDKLAAQQDQADDPAAYVGQLRAGMKVAWSALARMFTSGDKVHALPGSIWRQITENGKVSGWYLLFQLIGLIVVGLVAERLAKRMLEKKMSKPVEMANLGKRFDLACFGAVMGLLELGAFAAGAILFVEITGQQAQAALGLWYQLIWCLVLIKIVLLAVRQLVSPGESDTRLVSVSDAAARQALAWSVILTASLVLPQPLITIATDFGADKETGLLLSVIFGAIFVTLLIVLVVRLRRYGAKLIAGEEAISGSIRQGLARIWWMLTIVYLLAIWFMSIGKHAATGESTMVPGLGSLMLFVLIPYFDMGLNWLITRYFEYKEEEPAPAEALAADESSEAQPSVEAPIEPAPAETLAADESSAAQPSAVAPIEPDTSTNLEASTQDLETSAQAYEPGYIAIALRYARVLMVLAILAIFLRLWDIDIRAISAQLLGQRFASALFDIGITVLLTWALWGVIRISIERKLDDGKGPVTEDTGESDAGGLGGTRVETILPLIRIFIKITLIVMAVLISLSALGVNIGPLIAGAGVVGIAIGFGAQTLVRDIVSGFFYLIDDAFRIGEYVVIDQIRGTVEKISIRSFQLRHHNGPVHTIPYGEILTLTNWSRDWAIMKFELRIPFETDIDMVRKTIKQIGIEMMEDPVFGPLMLQPVKSQGVNRMDDSALIIRCKFTAVPGQQYLIRREAFTRIQRVFEEKGIHFAPRRVLVEATTPQEAVRGAAAVLDQEVAGESAPKDNQSDQ
jgi:small-conductance mechanosensitive channel